jgi:hypothetical protein
VIRTLRFIVAICTLLSLLVGADAQRRRRDPLNAAEVEQLRETRLEPVKRLKLFVTFIQARMATLEQMRSDKRFAEGRGEQTHKLLGDVMALVEEMDRNIDMYADDKLDIRKALKEIVESNTALQLKLRALKETPPPGDKTSEEARTYTYMLEDARETVNDSLASARETLDEQNALAKEKQLKKEITP